MDERARRLAAEALLRRALGALVYVPRRDDNWLCEKVERLMGDIHAHLYAQRSECDDDCECLACMMINSGDDNADEIGCK